MTRISWGTTGTRHFEAGVDRGVFYPSVGPGVPWNGLLSIKEATEGTGQSIIYVDGQSYITQVSLGTFSAEVSAVTYPQEFEEYEGYDEHLTNQPRRLFNLCYRTLIGNDIESVDLGYKLHLVYNALAQPSDIAFTTLGLSADIIPFTWALTTTPVPIEDFRATSHLIIDTTRAYPSSIAVLEDILYGTISQPPRMPTVDEVLILFEAHALFRVIDHGDGFATIIGSDDAVADIGGDMYRLTWPTVVQIADDVYNLSSS